MIGWNIKFLEEFLVNANDLILEYSNWQDWRTDTDIAQITRTAVSGGRARLRLQTPPPPQQTSIGGAITAASLHVVPDQEFQQSGTERNKWTAVTDFAPVARFTPSTAHVSAFLRVNDRTWNRESPGTGTYPDQTRFGCFINGNSQGVLQFTGDDLRPGRSGFGNTNTDNVFMLSEDPFNSPTNLYRVQIIERQVLDGTWKTYWKAEVYNLTAGGPPIGSSSEIREDTVTGTYGIGIPELAPSKLGMGLGPGTAGGVDVERTGVSYWSYV